MKKKYYWLTTSNQSNFKDLKVDPQKRFSEDINLREGALWFYDSESDEAKAFLKEVRSFLKKLYCEKYNHKDRAIWMNDDWING